MMYVKWHGGSNFVVFSVVDIYVYYGGDICGVVYLYLFIIVCFLRLSVACCVVM